MHVMPVISMAQATLVRAEHNPDVCFWHIGTCSTSISSLYLQAALPEAIQAAVEHLMKTAYTPVMADVRAKIDKGQQMSQDLKKILNQIMEMTNRDHSEEMVREAMGCI